MKIATNSLLRTVRFCVLSAVALPAAAPLLHAQTPAAATGAATVIAADATAARDGSQDFDFLIGTWKAKLKRLDKPLTGSTTWIEFEGRQITSKIWDGRATLDEFTVDSPATKTRIDGLTIRLYNPVAKQWNIYWANAKDGTFGVPTVGGFSNGRGEFYDQEDYQGRKIFVRYVWSDITPDSAKFEQSFSIDGGKTWEPNWISWVEREKPSASASKP